MPPPFTYFLLPSPIAPSLTCCTFPHSFPSPPTPFPHLPPLPLSLTHYCLPHPSPLSSHTTSFPYPLPPPLLHRPSSHLPSFPSLISHYLTHGPFPHPPPLTSPLASPIAPILTHRSQTFVKYKACLILTRNFIRFIVSHIHDHKSYILYR